LFAANSKAAKSPRLGEAILLKTSKTAKCPRLGEDSAKIGLYTPRLGEAFFLFWTFWAFLAKKPRQGEAYFSPILTSPRQGEAFIVLL